MKALTSLLVIAILAASAAPVWARDLKTQSGEVYVNVVVTKKEATGLRISHEAGVAFIDFRNLSDAERKEFGFDAVAYAAANEEKIAAEKRRREALLAAQQAAAKRAAANPKKSLKESDEGG